MTESNYFLPAGYVSRPEPRYFADTQQPGMVWQPFVYPHAASLADKLGCRKIVDVGCGHAGKLVPLSDRFAVTGIDYGSNIAFCRNNYQFGTWIEMDLGKDDETIPAEVVAGSVVICSDVVEHIPDPYILLHRLKKTLNDGARAVVVSTPCRVSTYGAKHNGPPPNACHCREWSLSEFGRLMSHCGMPTEELILTESNNRSPLKATILAVSYG